MQIIVIVVIIVEHGSSERIQPADAELAEDALQTFQKMSLLADDTSIFFFFQIFDARLVVIDALHLDEEHDQGEDGKQERLEQQSDNQNDRPRRYLSAGGTLDRRNVRRKR